jgi:hypothetical protein
MADEIIIFKSVFRIALRPMMDLFDHKKKTLNPDQWVKFINTTKSRIISNPDQFLGKDLPSAQLILEITEEIFADYLQEEMIEN